MKFYFEAAPYLDTSGKGGSLANRIFNNKKLTNSPKHVFAVVYSTLRFKEYIEIIIRKSKIKSGLNTSKLKISDNVLMLLVHDLLFSAKGRIQSGKHPIKEAFLQHKTRLQAEFIKLKLKYKVKSVDELPSKGGVDDDETPVRWCRINTIKISPEQFYRKHPFFAALQPVSSIGELTDIGMVYHDDYIPNLLGIHPREKLTSSNAYRDGEVIIQDRASCFPAVILNNDPEDVHHQVIDACAAPGNKTTHSASYLPNTAAKSAPKAIANKPAENRPALKARFSASDNVVYAFERDARRVEILKTMCKKATGKAKSNLIHVTHADFTTTYPEDFPEVTGMVVDPSCSGSGIFGRAIEDSQQEQEKDEQFEDEVEARRLTKLASFQFTIMKHALSFTSARKVVYSTCSIHPHENERVVVDLLLDREVQKHGWTLAPRSVVIPQWERRGWPQEFESVCGSDKDKCIEMAGGCVRAVPKEDGGIGFFAACFVKPDAIEEAKAARASRLEDQNDDSDEDNVSDNDSDEE